MSAAPPGDPGKNETKRKVFRPISESAYIAHKISRHSVLMLHDKISDCVIKIKRRSDGNRGDYDPDEPIQSSAAFHK